MEQVEIKLNSSQVSLVGNLCSQPFGILLEEATTDSPHSTNHRYNDYGHSSVCGCWCNKSLRKLVRSQRRSAMEGNTFSSTDRQLMLITNKKISPGFGLAAVERVSDACKQPGK